MVFLKKCGILVLSLALAGCGCGGSKKKDKSSQAVSSVSKSEQVSSEVSSEQTSSVESEPAVTVSEAQPSEALSSENQESKSSLTPEQERYAFISKYEAELRVITKEMLNNYLTDYKIPWTERWQIVPFDDEAIFVTTKVSIDGVAVKQPVIAIFTYYPDEKRWVGHYLLVGDAELYNDHYADEFFENISAFTNGG